MLALMFFVLCASIGFLYFHFKARFSGDVTAPAAVSSPASPSSSVSHPVVSPSSFPVPPSPISESLALQGATRPRAPSSGNASGFDSAALEFSGCFATPKTCACQLKNGDDAGLSESVCLDKLGITSLPLSSGSFGVAVLSGSVVPQFFIDARRNFKLLHPYRNFRKTKVYVMGSKRGYYD